MLRLVAAGDDHIPIASDISALPVAVRDLCVFPDTVIRSLPRLITFVCNFNTL